MAFYKDDSGESLQFENEIVEVKTINGSIYVYSEKKILGKKKVKDSALFFDKNEALSNTYKRYERYQKEKEEFKLKEI